MTVGIISHDLKSARDIFRDKIKLAFDNLPLWLRSIYTVDTDSVNEISFTKNYPDGTKSVSRISVGTTFRWWTINFLHISEFGKICAKYPDRAREIVTGAIEAVPQDGIIFIESTAEGSEWYFYDYSMEAKKMMDMGSKLSKFQYRLHFHPRWGDINYRSTTDEVITDEYVRYFDVLETRYGIKLDKNQKNWYIAKERILGDDMLREYPSYLEEAFNIAIKWAYYERELTLARKQGRLGKVAYEPALPVHIAWDLAGWGGWDNHALWFFQLFGKEVRLINYWEGNFMSLWEIYYQVVTPLWYKIDTVYLPHDANVTESISGTTRAWYLEELGLYVEVLPILAISDGIQNVRTIFGQCYFDLERCSSGIKCLDNYRREWDEKRGAFKDRPYHNWASHGADAFRYLATAVKHQSSSSNFGDMKPVISNWM